MTSNCPMTNDKQLTSVANMTRPLRVEKWGKASWMRGLGRPVSMRPPLAAVLLLFAGLTLVSAHLVGEALAVPNPLRDDLSIRRVMNLPDNTVRIERDPTDGLLYGLKLDGTIFHIDLENATVVPVYTAADHGVAPRSSALDGACGTRNCDATLGFAIGPDGTFYLTGNRHGTLHRTLARVFEGSPDENGVRRWEEVGDLAAALIPLAELRQAAQQRQRTATDPVLSILRLSQEGDIIRFNGELVVATEEHGVPAPDALFIDDEGRWFLLLVDEEDLRRYNIASVVRGRVDAGERVWSLVAETQPYPFSGSGVDNVLHVHPPEAIGS